MADTGNNGGQGQPAPQQAQQQPGLHVLGQYIKDLSFENPGAPRSLRTSDKGPNINLNIGINAQRLSETDFEVELKIDARAARGDETLFIVEVVYAGLFQVRNVPSEHLQPLLQIECPRLLFPFARQIVADATRQGGFPPLMIDPVDFTTLYRQRMMSAQAQQPAAPPS